MKTVPKKYFVALFALVLSVPVFFEWMSVTHAVVQTTVGQTIITVRRRFTTADIIAGTAADGGKRVVLGNLAPANALIMGVTNVTTPFTITGSPGAFIQATRLVVEDATGTQLSSGDIEMPPALNRINLENRPGNSIEHAFYSEVATTTVVMYIQAFGASGGFADLNSLATGGFDLYFILAKP